MISKRITKAHVKAPQLKENLHVMESVLNYV